MTYEYTYTLKDYKWVIYNGHKSIAEIKLDILGKRTDGSTVKTYTFTDECFLFPHDAKDWVYPRSITHDRDTTPNFTRTAKDSSAWTDFDSLNIAVDLPNWAKAIWEDSSNLTVNNARLDEALA